MYGSIQITQRLLDGPLDLTGHVCFMPTTTNLIPVVMGTWLYWLCFRRNRLPAADTIHCYRCRRLQRNTCRRHGASDLSVCSDELFSVSMIRSPLMELLPMVQFSWWCYLEPHCRSYCSFFIISESPRGIIVQFHCTVSGATGSSDPLFIDNNSPGTCLRTNYFWCGDGDFISHVIAEWYRSCYWHFPIHITYYPDQNTDLLIDSTYTIYVTCGSYPPIIQWLLDRF